MRLAYRSFFVSLAFLVGCQAEPEQILMPTGMRLAWDSLPHRVSQLELTADLESSPALVTAQNDGGDFGSVDYPRLEYQYLSVSHPGLVMTQGSTTLSFPAASDDSTADSPEVETTVQLGRELADSEQVVVILRGFRVDTNRYESPPSFASDPAIAYDPALGYTTGGLSIRLDEPNFNDGQWSVRVAGRNRVLRGDREDMNAAIAEATTWMRVDYLAIGLPNDVSTSFASTEYTINNPTFGTGTEHLHAPAADQALTFEAMPGHGILGYGLRSFDVSLNVEGLYDDGCTVVNEDLNAWGEPIHGPGRYLRDLSLKVQDMVSHDDGSVHGALDLFISNSSVLNEIGNICAAYSGTVLLLRAPDATAPVEQTLRHRFASGELTTQALDVANRD